MHLEHVHSFPWLTSSRHNNMVQSFKKTKHRKELTRIVDENDNFHRAVGPGEILVGLNHF